MDLWGIVMVIFLTFLIMSCCGYCCSSKRRGAVLSTPVVVTSATHTAPGGYPVTQMGPAYQTNVYQAPYPPQGVPGAMPMPMHMPVAQPPAPGMQPHMAPYPPGPGPMPAGTMNPPSYDMAVAGSSTGYPNNAPYEKQSAYNPNYSTH